MILDWLMRRGRWGADYFSLDTLVNKLSHAVRNNGRRIRKSVRELVQEGSLLIHERGETISLNPSLNRDILDHIEQSLESRLALFVASPNIDAAKDPE